MGLREPLPETTSQGLDEVFLSPRTWGSLGFGATSATAPPGAVDDRPGTWCSSSRRPETMARNLVPTRSCWPFPLPVGGWGVTAAGMFTAAAGAGAGTGGWATGDGVAAAIGLKTMLGASRARLGDISRALR